MGNMEQEYSDKCVSSMDNLNHILFDCLVSTILLLLLLKSNSLPLLLDSKSLPADWASAAPVEVIISTICEYARALHSLKDHVL